MSWPELKLAAVEDTVSYVICMDAGWIADDASVGMLAYPDICQLECGNPIIYTCWEWGSESEPPGWDVMSTADCCGDAYVYYAPFNGAFLASVELRKPYARHLGGSNLGFLDGHASWIASERILNMKKENELAGVDAWGPTSDCGFGDSYPGVPTIY